MKGKYTAYPSCGKKLTTELHGGDIWEDWLWVDIMPGSDYNNVDDRYVVSGTAVAATHKETYGSRYSNDTRYQRLCLDCYRRAGFEW